MKRTDAIQHFVEQWRDLRAWGRPLTEVKIEYRQRSEAVGDYSTGRCYTIIRRIIITVAPDDMPQSLSTGLHELAHAAAPADIHHGPWWRHLYASAVEEVTGRPVYEATGEETPLPLLRSVVCDILRAWWKEQSLDRLWTMAADRKR